MGGIFISYRRGDSQGSAGRLFDDLKRRFPQEQIFIDVDSIAIGEDFQDAIERYVASCHVQLVVIGPDWLGARGSNEPPRLHDAEDFVHIEVKSALERKIPVVPILVQGATMPRKEQLPSGLERLVRRNAVELRHTRWDDDIAELMDALERMPRPDAPGGQKLLESTPSRESLAVGALTQRLLAARSRNDLEAIAFEVEALERDRPNDIEVVRLKRRVQDAMRFEQPPRASSVEDESAPMPRSFNRRPAFAAAAGIVAVIGALFVYQVMRTSTPGDTGSAVESPDKETAPEQVSTRGSMPDVTGMTLQSARRALASASLKVEERTVESRRPEGTVLRQDPPPGTEVEKGALATLTYAIPMRERMPNLVGLDVKSAMLSLEKHGLVLEKRTASPESTEKVAPYTVISQDPPADAAIEKGQRVSLVYAVAAEACISGYVWRNAFRGDHVCVTRETAEQTAIDNKLAPTRRAGSGPYGPDTCVSGYVWREARPEDLVCVTPETRNQVRADNAAASKRTLRR